MHQIKGTCDKCGGALFRDTERAFNRIVCQNGHDNNRSYAPDVSAMETHGRGAGHNNTGKDPYEKVRYRRKF